MHVFNPAEFLQHVMGIQPGQQENMTAAYMRYSTKVLTLLNHFITNMISLGEMAATKERYQEMFNFFADSMERVTSHMERSLTIMKSPLPEHMAALVSSLENCSFLDKETKSAVIQSYAGISRPCVKVECEEEQPSYDEGPHNIPPEI